jgi:hypothetical protein
LPHSLRQPFHRQRLGNVRFPPYSEPTTDIGLGRFQCKTRFTALFDHQIGQLLNVQGQVQAESFRSLKIYNQFEFRRRLNREIAGFFAFQNAIDISRRKSKLITLVSAVR